MPALLIDLNKMKIIKAADGKDAIRRLEYWAEILLPKGDFYIGAENQRELSIFTLMELKMLYRNTSGEEMLKDDYERVLSMVHILGQRTETDGATVGELVKKLKRPLGEPTVKPQVEKRASKPSSTQPTRPRAGTVTAKVWEIADEMMAGDPGLGFESKEFRQCVIEECGKETINPSTAATQFAKWKRDQLSR